MNKDLSFKYLYTALADELLASYQYWTAKNSSRGEGKSDVDPEFDAHSNEEMDHANQVMERIKQLGGEPYPDPKDWEGAANPWQPITTRDIKSQLEITMKAEATAIAFYEKAVEDLRNEDPVSHKLFRSLLKDEEEHLYDLKELYCELTGASFEDIDKILEKEEGESSKEENKPEGASKEEYDVEEDSNEEYDVEEEEDGLDVHASVEEEEEGKEEEKAPETFDKWAPYMEKRIEKALTSNEELENMAEDSYDTLSAILNDLYNWEDEHPEEVEANSEWFNDLETRLEDMVNGMEDVEDFFGDLSFDDLDEEEEEKIEEEDLEEEEEK